MGHVRTVSPEVRPAAAAPALGSGLAVTPPVIPGRNFKVPTAELLTELLQTR